MRQTKLQTEIKALAIAACAALILLIPTSTLRAATATALVSATVLGPAETEIASGAVTISKVSESSGIEIARSGVSRDLRTLSAFRIGGGFHASYAVALPETVTVKNGDGEFRVSGFGTSSVGRLASDGTASFEIGAAVTVPAGQAAGTYMGSYPVTIAYN
jgi:hypothetical protein